MCSSSPITIYKLTNYNSLMSPVTRVPPVSEASFRKDYFLMWVITGAGCLIIGFGVAPMLYRIRQSWLTIMAGIATYLISILLCQVSLGSIWRRPLVTPGILYFSVPVGGFALLAVGIMNWLGPQFQIGRRTLACLSLSVGLLYVASLVWSVGIGIRRKKMGDFEVVIRR
jgi:hypothetical protein